MNVVDNLFANGDADGPVIGKLPFAARRREATRPGMEGFEGSGLGMTKGGCLAVVGPAPPAKDRGLARVRAFEAELGPIARNDHVMRFGNGN